MHVLTDRLAITKMNAVCLLVNELITQYTIMFGLFVNYFSVPSLHRELAFYSVAIRFQPDISLAHACLSW